MRILFIGSVAMSFRMLIEGIMQASGDTVSPMKITIGYRFFHIVLCPFLIFGWWIFPALGVSGAALTNVISQIVNGVALPLILVFMLRLTNDRKLMGDFANKKGYNIIAWGTVGLLVVLTAAYLALLLGL